MALITRLLFCCLCFALVALIQGNRRATRALAFPKGSTYFYRLNYKLNSIPGSLIFAQAAGFKVAWELPGPSRQGRSVPDALAAELVYESHGFDGRSCIMKNICQALEYVKRRDGTITKILKLLVRSYMSNDTSAEDSLYCDVHVRNCPLELIGIDSFMEH